MDGVSDDCKPQARDGGAAQMHRTALIAGASGQVGSGVLALVLERSSYSRVTVLTRRPIGLRDPRMVEVVVPNFDNLEAHATALVGDDVFLCLGTSSTDAEGFEKVDFVYPELIGRCARDNGASRVLFVSALGANPASRNRYFRTKGRIELAIEAMGYPSSHILRPAVMYGAKDQARTAQRIARIVTHAVERIIPGRLTRYLAIPSFVVARAMVHAALAAPNGTHRYESDQIWTMAKPVFDESRTSQ